MANHEVPDRLCALRHRRFLFATKLKRAVSNFVSTPSVSISVSREALVLDDSWLRSQSRQTSERLTKLRPISDDFGYDTVPPSFLCERIVQFGHAFPNFLFQFCRGGSNTFEF